MKLCVWALVTKCLQNVFTEMYHNFIGDSNRTICWPLLKGTVFFVFDMVAFSTGATATQISINILIVYNLNNIYWCGLNFVLLEPSDM